MSDFNERDKLRSDVLNGLVAESYKRMDGSVVQIVTSFDPQYGRFASNSGFAYCPGSILNASVDVIAHQTNCKGVMGSGVAKAIRERYPEIFSKYQEACKKQNMLGQCQLIQTYSGVVVANLFGQDGYGRSGVYTDYDALTRALISLCDQMEQDGLISVAFPYLMGCGLGGGQWNMVEDIIRAVFSGKNIQVEIWALDGFNEDLIGDLSLPF